LFPEFAVTETSLSTTDRRWENGAQALSYQSNLGRSARPCYLRAMVRTASNPSGCYAAALAGRRDGFARVTAT